MASGRIAVVLGTRPEIIKMAEVIKLLGERAWVIHTGQHWDHAMSGQFLEALEITNPHVQLAVGGASRGAQIGEAVSKLDELLAVEQPDALVVQGDTNAVVAGGLAANANCVPLVHVEAGLRSYDRAMPEEHNRVIVDHLADLCLAPTEQSRSNLLAEGIAAARITVTGNTIVGVLTRVLAHAEATAPALLERWALQPNEYVVATIHRPENTDDPDSLNQILSALGELELPVVFPIHPRTRARVDEFGLQAALEPLVVVEPLSYQDFVTLGAKAALTVSDSGGVQEEASVWKRPVLVVRRSTERPEVQGTFAELVQPGTQLLERCRALIADRVTTAARLRDIPSPYGDEGAARRTVEAIDLLLAHGA